MDWDNLKVFLAVAEAGSLAGASRRLQMSQATVWRRVQGLELSLNATLFERRAMGYALTAAGTVLLRRLGGLHGKVEAACQGLGSELDGADGEVRVTAPEFAGLMITAGMPLLRRNHPRLVIELLTRSPIAALMARDVDIALRIEPLPAGAFTLEDVYAIPFSLYAAPAYIERFGKPVAMEDLEGHNLIDFDYSMAHLAPKPWQRSGGRNATVVFRSNSPNCRLAAARDGIGLALLPEPLVGNDPRLRPVIGSDTIGHLELRLFVRGEMQRDARLGAARDFLTGIFSPYRRTGTTRKSATRRRAGRAA